MPLNAGKGSPAMCLLCDCGDKLRQVAEGKSWVIRKTGYFYRANRAGYTQEISAAGLYTEAEAKAEATVEPGRITAHPLSEFL